MADNPIQTGYARVGEPEVGAKVTTEVGPTLKGYPTRNVYLAFQGIGASGLRLSFETLCGQNPPTFTDGYGIFETVPRLMQRGLTIFQGYNPMQMVVELIFGSWTSSSGWDQSPAAGDACELDLMYLDWMAGGGILQGRPPIIYIFSYATGGGQSDLIPVTYQGQPWVVATNGLQWGTAYRNANGSRVYQEVTVTLQQYLNPSSPPKAQTSVSGSYFTSVAGRDEALLIAGSPAANSPTVDVQSLAQSILSDAKNNPCRGTKIKLKGRSVRWTIKHGTKVWIPNHTAV